MSFFENALRLIRPAYHLRSLGLRASVVAFIVTIGLVSVVLMLDIVCPELAPRLIPILVVTLGLALVFAVFSLWRVRSEHRGTDRAFRNTDCEFSSIFQNALDGILILDNDANCLDVNLAGASILRIVRNDLIGKNICTFFQHSDAFGQRWKDFLRSKRRKGRIKLTAGDGTTAIVDYSGVGNYLPGRHIFILRDVTKQTGAEKALRESEERLRYVADNIHEIIWRMNAVTKEVVDINHAYTTITGHSVEALHQDPCSYQELIHPQDRIRVLSRLKEAVVSGTFDEEFQFVHANGTIRWIWVKGSLASKSGSAQWLVGTAMDITARKQAEQQISEHLDAAEAARAEAEALRKATLALSQNLSMDSVLDTLLECIGRLVPFDKATVLFIDDAEHIFVAREAPGPQARNTICVLSAHNNSILQRILFEHKPVLFSDTEREPEWRDWPPFERTRCWLGIPLIAASRVIGVLSLSNRTPGSLTAEHLRMAKNLAISAAVAIENARIHERAAIYASELELRLQDLHEAQEALAKTNKQPSIDTHP